MRKIRIHVALAFYIWANYGAMSSGTKLLISILFLNTNILVHAQTANEYLRISQLNRSGYRMVGQIIRGILLVEKTSNSVFAIVKKANGDSLQLLTGFEIYPNEKLLGNEWMSILDQYARYQNGFIYYSNKNETKIIDTTGKVIFNRKISLETPFKNGDAFYSTPDVKDGNFGIINFNGELRTSKVEASVYKNMEDYNDGLFLINKDNKTMIVDTNGKNQLPNNKYQLVSVFYDDYAGVLFNDKRGFIDRKGNLKIQPVYDYAGNFNKGICVAVKYLDGGIMAFFIDKNGHEFFKIECGEIGDFSEGIVAIRRSQGARWGYIDKTGKMIIEPKFTSAGPFINGLARVSENDNKSSYFINTKGEKVL